MKIFYDPKFQEEERSGPVGLRSSAVVASGLLQLVSEGQICKKK